MLHIWIASDAVTLRPRGARAFSAESSRSYGRFQEGLVYLPRPDGLGFEPSRFVFELPKAAEPYAPGVYTIGADSFGVADGRLSLRRVRLEWVGPFGSVPDLPRGPSLVEEAVDWISSGCPDS